MTTDQRLDHIERILTLFFNAGRREWKKVREVDEKITMLINEQIKNDDRFQKLRDQTNRKWQETDRRFQETNRQIQETSREMREGFRELRDLFWKTDERINRLDDAQKRTDLKPNELSDRS